MNEFAASSVFFGVFVTLAAYFLGLKVKEKTGLAIMNPLLIAIVLVMLLLRGLDIDYAAYNQSARLVSSLLTPATVCLAVPLYEQLQLLKRHKAAILTGVISGVLTSLVCVLVLAMLFGLDHAAYVTLLPKSITTAIGMGVSEQLGGHVSITVAVIIITGVIGNMIAESVCRAFHITEPIARGVAIGTASHAIGTTKAMELGEVEGAMSSLSIVVAGVLTVAGASVFSLLL
ncbi:MAG: LrgB family protein [Candidatus Ventricola sp.]|nr:LrgB family protein [Clostridiales bacterium]MDY3832337.1 LrgB family protein [Candidatus Ventricola sp.]